MPWKLYCIVECSSKPDGLTDFLQYLFVEAQHGLYPPSICLWRIYDHTPEFYTTFDRTTTCVKSHLLQVVIWTTWAVMVISIIMLTLAYNFFPQFEDPASWSASLPECRKVSS